MCPPLISVVILTVTLSQVRNQWTTSWGMKGFIRLEFGTNACGITSFTSFVSTTIYPPKQPITSPTVKPTKSIQAPSPSLTPLHAARSKMESKLVSKYNKPTHIKTNAARNPSFNNYYNYLYQYLPPDVKVSARTSSAPVQYYSSSVRYGYSPKPSLSNRDFFYYGTSAPTVTHRPTWSSLGQFGYSEGSTTKPSNAPLSYYGDFYRAKVNTFAPTLVSTGTCMWVRMVLSFTSNCT